MRVAVHSLAILAASLVVSPLSAQTVPGQLPSEDLTSNSVPPAPPPERYSPPSFPRFSRTPPKPKTAPAPAKSRRPIVDRTKAHVARESAAADNRRLSSRERKDERWCLTLSRRQLSHNSKCRKILERKNSAIETPRPSTRQDRIAERRCGKLTLKQVLRDRRCRAFAQRQLAGAIRARSETRHGSKAKNSAAQRQAKRSSARHHPVKKRSGR
jgi:hypothetical protein